LVDGSFFGSMDSQVLSGFILIGMLSFTNTRTALFSRKLCNLYAAFSLFTAGRYVSAVDAVALCPSVFLSQIGVLSKRVDESSWFLL